MWNVWKFLERRSLRFQDEVCASSDQEGFEEGIINCDVVIESETDSSNQGVAVESSTKRLGTLCNKFKQRNNRRRKDKYEVDAGRSQQVQEGIHLQSHPPPFLAAQSRVYAYNAEGSLAGVIFC